MNSNDTSCKRRKTNAKLIGRHTTRPNKLLLRQNLNDHNVFITPQHYIVTKLTLLDMVLNMLPDHAVPSTIRRMKDMVIMVEVQQNERRSHTVGVTSEAAYSKSPGVRHQTKEKTSDLPHRLSQANQGDGYQDSVHPSEDNQHRLGEEQHNQRHR